MAFSYKLPFHEEVDKEHIKCGACNEVTEGHYWSATTFKNGKTRAVCPKCYAIRGLKELKVRKGGGY